MNISTLPSSALRSLASIKQQIENLEQQAEAVLNGSPVPAGVETVVEAAPTAEAKPKNGAWTPARRRAVRAARLRQVAKWKRQGLDGRGQPR